MVKSTDTPEEKQEAKTPAEQVPQEARMWAMFCHLAGLAWMLWWIVPVIGGVVGPLILWQIKKHEYPFIDDQGKEAINFQISMLLYCLVAVLLCFCGVGFVLLPVIAVVDVVFAIIAAVRTSNGVAYRYPLSIRFVR